MEKNKAIFQEIHKSILKTLPKYSIENEIVARCSNTNNQRVLYIDNQVPHISDGAGFPRGNAIISRLVEASFDVTVYSLCWNMEPWKAQVYPSASSLSINSPAWAIKL